CPILRTPPVDTPKQSYLGDPPFMINIGDFPCDDLLSEDRRKLLPSTPHKDKSIVQLVRVLIVEVTRNLDHHLSHSRFGVRHRCHDFFFLLPFPLRRFP